MGTNGPDTELPAAHDLSSSQDTVTRNHESRSHLQSRLSYIWTTNDSMFSRDVDRWLGGDTGSPTHADIPPQARLSVSTPRSAFHPQIQQPSLPSSGFWYVAALVLPLINLNVYRHWRCSPSSLMNTAELMLSQVAGYCRCARNRVRRLANEQGARDIFAGAMDIVLVVMKIENMNSKGTSDASCASSSNKVKSVSNEMFESHSASSARKLTTVLEEINDSPGSAARIGKSKSISKALNEHPSILSATRSKNVSAHNDSASNARKLKSVSNAVTNSSSVSSAGKLRSVSKAVTKTPSVSSSKFRNVSNEVNVCSSASFKKSEITSKEINDPPSESGAGKSKYVPEAINDSSSASSDKTLQKISKERYDCYTSSSSNDSRILNILSKEIKPAPSYRANVSKGAEPTLDFVASISKGKQSSHSPMASISKEINLSSTCLTTNAKKIKLAHTYTAILSKDTKPTYACTTSFSKDITKKHSYTPNVSTEIKPDIESVAKVSKPTEDNTTHLSKEIKSTDTYTVSVSKEIDPTNTSRPSSIYKMPLGNKLLSKKNSLHKINGSSSSVWKFERNLITKKKDSKEITSFNYSSCSLTQTSSCHNLSQKGKILVRKLSSKEISGLYSDSFFSLSFPLDSYHSSKEKNMTSVEKITVPGRILKTPQEKALDAMIRLRAMKNHAYARKMCLKRLKENYPCEKQESINFVEKVGTYFYAVSQTLIRDLRLKKCIGRLNQKSNAYTCAIPEVSSSSSCHSQPLFPKLKSSRSIEINPSFYGPKRLVKKNNSRQLDQKLVSSSDVPTPETTTVHCALNAFINSYYYKSINNPLTKCGFGLLLFWVSMILIFHKIR